MRTCDVARTSWWCGLVVCCGALTAAEPPLVAPTEPLTAAEQLEMFHLPPGFKIELVASEPSIRKPMNLKFDAAGRMFVSQSIEYPWPVGAEAVGRDTIQCFVDTNGDGVPDAPHDYAAGLNIPIGLTPVHGGLLGYSIPSLYFFGDADGDGVADDRRELYQTFGFRDTHGMCSSLNWWIDGWVYGSHGFANESKVTGADGRPIVMQSGNTYRLRPDGTRIEYYTHGQVNPFGMALDPYGQVFTSDCHTKPAYLLLRGAHYPSFGKPHDGLGFGPELLQHLHGSTGISGIVYYAADHFPPEYHAGLLIGNPVTGRVNRDTLEQTGATFRAVEQPDFLTCDDPWFRPVDLQLGPDGSLYIADFYNRIIGHYEVPLTHPGRDRERGRIWRVSYSGATPAPAVDLSKATIDELLDTLALPRLAQRVHATHQLVHRYGMAAIEPTRARVRDRTATATMWVHGLWVLERLGALTPDELQLAAAHADALVRAHAMQILRERPSDTAWWRDLTRRGTSDTAAIVRRFAVEAIGCQPYPKAEDDVLAVWGASADDAFLVHSCKVALREVALVHDYFATRPAAEFGSQAVQLRQVALAVPRASSSDFLLSAARLPAALTLSPAEIQHVARYGHETHRQQLDAELVGRPWTRLVDARESLQAAHRGAQERGATLATALSQLAERMAVQELQPAGEANPIPALESVRDFGLKEPLSNVTRLALDAAQPLPVRTLAMDALATGPAVDLIKVAREVLVQEVEPVELKRHAIQIMATRSDADARDLLLDRLRTASSGMEEALARGLALSPPNAVALLTAMEQGRASSRLLKDAVVHERLTNAKIDKYTPRREALLAALPVEPDGLGVLIAARRAHYSQLAPRDHAVGAALFKKHCQQCHRLANEGNKVGPELDGVGLRGLDRLLEDTLDPNRNVDQAFRTTIIALSDGRVIAGLALRDEGQALVMVDEQAREQRIPLTEIEERKVVNLSPMPANLAEKLTPDEYGHLLEFLLQQRTAKAERVELP